MTDKPTAVDIVAAREHAISSRRTRVHVIVCHDLNRKSRTLLELFSLASTVDPEVCAMIARELAEDIIRDADVLIADLENIKQFANRQLAKLPTPLRE